MAMTESAVNPRIVAEGFLGFFRLNGARACRLNCQTIDQHIDGRGQNGDGGLTQQIKDTQIEKLFMSADSTDQKPLALGP
jgi:hypothetical protein